MALRSPASGLFHVPGDADEIAATSQAPHYGFRFVRRGSLVGFAARADDEEAVRYVQTSRARPFRLALGAPSLSPFAQFVVSTSTSGVWEGRPTVRLKLASRMLPQFEWSVEIGRAHV